MKNLKDKRIDASFVFSYCYGSLVPQKENFITINIFDDEIVKTHILPSNEFNDKNNNERSKKDLIKSKKLKEYLLLETVNNKLNKFINLSFKELKISKNIYKRYIYIKLNNKEYNLEGNANNKDYKNFFNELVENSSTIIGFDIDENVSSNISLNEKISEINNGDFFLDELVKNFIEGIGINVTDAIKVLDKLSAHKDIYDEFTKYLMKKEYPNLDCIKIEGYKAKDIHLLAPLMNAINVYSLIVDLREEPKRAHQIIANGFSQNIKK